MVRDKVKSDPHSRFQQTFDPGVHRFLLDFGSPFESCSGPLDFKRCLVFHVGFQVAFQSIGGSEFHIWDPQKQIFGVRCVATPNFCQHVEFNWSQILFAMILGWVGWLLVGCWLAARWLLPAGWLAG